MDRKSVYVCEREREKECVCVSVRERGGREIEIIKIKKNDFSFADPTF